MTGYLAMGAGRFLIGVGINWSTQTVTSSNEALKKRVEAVLDMAVTTISSLSEAFTSGTPLASEDAALTQEKEGMEELEKAVPQDTGSKVEDVTGNDARVGGNGSKA